MKRKFFKPDEAQEERLEPVDRMMATMRRAGQQPFHEPGMWEQCLCALVLALEPKCRTYRFLEALPAGRQNYCETDILNTLAHLGYFARKVPIAIGALDERLFPSLFIQQDGTPVILVEREGGRIRIYRNGAITYLTEDQVAGHKGKAWIFERYDENRPSMSKFMRAGNNYSWFRALAGRFRGTYAQVLAAGLILNILSLTTPLFIMLIYNRVIATGTADVLPMLMAGMALAVGFEMALRSIRSSGLSWIATRMDNLVGNHIFAHLLGLSPSLIERASVSAQIARIKTFESVRDFFCGSVFLSIIEFPFVIIAALAIYFIAGPLVLVPLAMGAAYALLFAIIYKKVRTSMRLAAKASSAKQQFSIETFEKIKAVRAYGLTGLWQMKFRDLSGKEMMAHFHLNWLGMIGENMAHALTILSAVATVAFGVHMIWAGQMGTGALVATMILVWRVLTPFYSLCTMIPRLEQIRNSLLQVNQLMDLDTEAQLARAASRLSRIEGRIQFANAGLRYQDDGDFVLRDLDLDARPGDLVVITGENGAGKTSLLKMVKGLYKPSEGTLQIDGFDLRQLDETDLRRQIAYVPQTGDFFHGSILDNLRIANPIASEDEMQAALGLADAMAGIDALPDGLHTVISRYSVGTLAANLGLRLSLARLYLHTAPILLIDEIPNVILSGPAGRNLQDYLARIKGQRTCLMVSYRDDFMKMADTIVYLRRGKTPAAGSPDKILNAMMEAA